MIFQTPRLVARLLSEEDFDSYFELQGNPNVMRYTGLSAQTESEARADLKRVMLKTQRDSHYNVWALELRSDGGFVGNAAVMIEQVGEEMWGEIGYRILERHWRRGYGREAAEGLLRHARGVMGLEKVRAFAASGNAGSIRILEGLGMKKVGEAWKEEFGWWEWEYRLGE